MREELVSISKGPVVLEHSMLPGRAGLDVWRNTAPGVQPASKAASSRAKSFIIDMIETECKPPKYTAWLAVAPAETFSDG